MSRISRTATEPNGCWYETQLDWDVEWHCWRHTVVRFDPNGEWTVLSDERITDDTPNPSTGVPGALAAHEMQMIEAAARRDDRRADRKAKAEYYAGQEGGGIF